MSKSVLRNPVYVPAPVGSRRILVGVMVAVAILTGCSAPSDSSAPGSAGSDEVASVADPSKPVASQGKSGSGDSGSGGAPQLRLDTTDQEELVMYQPYLQCLKDHGVPLSKAGANGGKPSGTSSNSSLWWFAGAPDDYPEAERACGKKRPLPVRELDPRTNPDFLDDFRAQIKCLNDHGLKVTGLSDGSGWNFAEGYKNVPNEDQIIADCEMKAFGGKD